MVLTTVYGLRRLTSNLGEGSHHRIIKGVHFWLSFLFCHARNLLAFCLNVRGFVMAAVRETFALDTLKSNCRTFPVCHPAGVPFEIPFRKIAR